jgi:hypothetical protein
VFLVAIFF